MPFYFINLLPTSLLYISTLQLVELEATLYLQVPLFGFDYDDSSFFFMVMIHLFCQ